ncbi:MAG: phage holin family protein [Streptosporangiales bacterium]|nr:phage holin family protein [Streptosporangiales bacterium]
MILIRILINAAALWVATALVDGISIESVATPRGALTLLVVAVIFGLVNAVIKPIVKTVGCLFYVLTLGLVALVVNALLFMLTGWLAGQLDLPFEVAGFWPAFWGALIVSIVSWLLSMFLGGRDDD